MPEAWLSEAEAARRAPCRVPQELAFHSQPQLAAARLQALAHEGVVPCK